MTRLTFQLTCCRSGLAIGNLDYMVVAGHMPYLSHWRELIAMHPIFSMERHKLLAFARKEWNRLAKRSEDGETTEGENDILRVCFLAMLHSLESVQQEAPALPPLHLVQTNMQRLFVLCYWHHYLESKRFGFPLFKINKLNANDRFENIGHYIDACFARKEDYEDGVNDEIEAAKIVAAERALHALRNSWITPASNKKLWAWVRAYLPHKYTADAQGWMGTLFLGNEKTITDFDKDEIELLSDIVQGECPPGTAIMHAVRQRLDHILRVHTDHREAFTVDFTSFIEGDEESEDGDSEAASKPRQPLVAPKQEDFPTKVAYIKANALFYLKKRALEEQAKKIAKGVANEL